MRPRHRVRPKVLADKQLGLHGSGQISWAVGRRPSQVASHQLQLVAAATDFTETRVDSTAEIHESLLKALQPG